jgi:glycerol uptake facilitator-like aquaporin
LAKLQIGSPKAWLTLFGFYLVFGILMVTQTSLADRATDGLLFSYFVLGSIVIAVRMWRMRGNPAKFWGSAHAGQAGLLPAKWRSWTLGE